MHHSSTNLILFPTVIIILTHPSQHIKINIFPFILYFKHYKKYVLKVIRSSIHHSNVFSELTQYLISKLCAAKFEYWMHDKLIHSHTHTAITNKTWRTIKVRDLFVARTTKSSFICSTEENSSTTLTHITQCSHFFTPLLFSFFIFKYICILIVCVNCISTLHIHMSTHYSGYRCTWWSADW